MPPRFSVEVKMRYDVAFINGVVRSRERFLWGTRLERLAEGTAAEAFKALKDGGFGANAEAEDGDFESLIRAEENSVNSFIREYAPSEATERFLLAEYDFHNAEALVKCRLAGADAAKMLAPEGFYKTEDIKKAIDAMGENPPADANDGTGKTLSAANDGMGTPRAGKKDKRENPLYAAAAQALALPAGQADGFTVDCVFQKALFRYMKRYAKGPLKAILANKADAANLSALLRSDTFEYAAQMFVEGGKWPESQLKAIFEGSADVNGELKRQVLAAREDAQNGRPLTAFEKYADEYPLHALYPTRYDMKGQEPFLSYIFKRREDIANARILAVCLAARLSPKETAARMRFGSHS